MEKVDFRINGRIEIFWDDGVYRCTVQDVTDEYLAISVPINNGRYIPLNRGERIEIVYYEDRDNIFRFIGVVTGRKVERIPVILLEIPDKVERIQRRRFVRVPVIQYVNISKVEPNLSMLRIEMMAKNKEIASKATLIDLSGGGLRLKVDSDINIGDMLVVILPLTTREVILKGKVVRVEIDDEKRRICGIDFIELSESVRDLIIRYIFEIMRQQRKKT